MLHGLVLATVLAAAPTARGLVDDLDARIASLPEGIELQAVQRPTRPEIVEVRGSLGGVPLSRPIAKVLTDAQGRIALVHDLGEVPPPVTTRPTLSRAEAVARVRALGIAGSRGPAEARLVLVPRPGASRLVWRIDPELDLAHLTDPVFDVDATTGDVTVAYDRVVSASVRAYAPNPVVMPVAAEYVLDEIDPGATNLVGPSWQAINCVDPMIDGICTPLAVATADPMGDFLFPAPDIDDPVQATDPTDPFAEASAYFHADRFHTHLTGLGLPGIPCQEAGGVPTIVTNYGQWTGGAFVPFEDAIYTGDCDVTIVVGQGPTLDLALEGDILYHEIGHGVIAQAIGGDGILNVPRLLPEALANDAGAIGEAIADFLSSSFTGDPYMGDYLRDYGELSAGRDNANPYTCPGGLMGKVHQDGEPFAAALWASYQALGTDFIPVVVTAVGMFAPDVSFEDAAEIIAVVAGVELGGAAEDTVRDAFATRGLTDCPRIVAWDEVERGVWMSPPAFLGYDPIVPPPYQIRIDVPDGVDEVTLEFSLEDFPFPAGPPDAQVGLLQKAGEPIAFSYAAGAGVMMVTYDAEAEVGGLEVGTVQLAVAPGPVYVAFANAGTTTAILSDLVVSWSPPAGGSDTGADSTGGDASTGTPPATDGAGTTGDGTSTTGDATDGGDDGSCACRATARPIAVGWWWCLLLAAARRRRVARSCLHV